MAKRAWSLLVLLLGSCAIPNISIVDSLGEGGSGGSSSNQSGASSQSGTRNEPGAGGGGTDVPGGTDSGAAGDPRGGTDPGGGTDQGGKPPTGGGGTGPMPAKTATAKFCNAVVVAGETVSFDLRVGEGANLTHIVAESGTCTPAVNRACLPIPTGSSVPVGVYDLDGKELYTAAVRIEPGDAWIFLLYFDDEAKAARLGGQNNTADECSATDFDDLAGATP
jgi:hypothetical protein